MFDKRLNLINENKDYLENFVQIASKKIYISLSANNKILFCGNGGSAAESQHMAAEYVATLDHRRPREGLSAIALTTDTSLITAWSNDFGFDTIFSRQISVLGTEGDILVCYSTSGNSINICNAVKEAIEKNINYLIFTGSNRDSKLANLSSKENIVFVESENTALIQEVHTMLGHDICYNVEKLIASK